MTNGLRICLIWASALSMLLFQGFHCPSLCNEMTAAHILEHLQAKFAEIDNYSVLLSIKTDITQVHVPQMEVMVFFKQPDKLHLQSKGFAMLPREGLLINPNRFRKEDFYMPTPEKEAIGDLEAFKLELVPRKGRHKIEKACPMGRPGKMDNT